MRRFLASLLFFCAAAGVFACEKCGGEEDVSVRRVAGTVVSRERKKSVCTENTTVQKDTSRPLLQKIEDWYAENMSLGTVALLMVVESSFIPFPSEIVVPPAAYVAGKKGSRLHITDSYFINVLLVTLFSTLGAMIGAMINYFLSLWLGRPLVYAFADSKIGHLFLLDSAKIQRAESYFNEYGKISTFVGRFIPAIRQLISIPAGLCKMHFGYFTLFTFFGAFCWNVILVLLGYLAHGQMDLIHQYSHELSIAIVVLFAVGIIYVIVKKILTLKS